MYLVFTMFLHVPLFCCCSLLCFFLAFLNFLTAISRFLNNQNSLKLYELFLTFGRHSQVFQSCWGTLKVHDSLYGVDWKPYYQHLKVQQT